jgi:hypothetical protein
MRRSYLLLVAALAPVPVLALSHGCSGETAFESVCDWVADPDNCLREFRAGMLATTTRPSSLNGDCTFPGGNPTEVDLAKGSDGTPNGAFLTTGMLATCIIDTGGSVTINPAINLAMWPPALESTPITYQMTFMDQFGVQCGTASYTSPHGFAISITAPAGTGTGGGTGAGGSFNIPDAGNDASFQAQPFFGTYTETIAPGRDAFDVTCPSGETHHLNLDESAGFPGADSGTVSACPAYAPLVPEAHLFVDPGGIGTTGAVSFAIVYPETPAQETYPATFSPEGKPLKANTVVYFNCTVPGQPAQCMDQMKDGAETDVDCGGPSVNGCPGRCLGGQACFCNDDCASDVCYVDPTSGLRKCYDPSNPPMSSDGGVLAVGDGVGKCTYSSVCNAPNTKCGTVCTDLTSDANNCGTCGKVCMGMACCSGTCSMTCGGTGGAGGSGTGGSGSGTGGSGVGGGG